MKLYTSYQDIPIEISGRPADSITRESSSSSPTA